MACGNASNQNQVSLPQNCNAHPAAFNLKDGSISFLPRLMMPRNESIMIQDVNSPTPQTLRNEYSMIPSPCLVTRHFPGRGSSPSMNHLHGSAPKTAENYNLLQHQLSSSGDMRSQHFQTPTNGSNLIQHSHFLNLQLPSNGAQMTETFHSVKDHLSTNESNIPQQSYSLTHRLPSFKIGMNQSSNMFVQLPSNGIMNQSSNRLIQQSSTSVNTVSVAKHSPIHGLSQTEPRRNHVKYLQSHQQSARESTRHQGLQSIFKRHSSDGLGTVENPYMLHHQTIGNQGSYPPSIFPEIGLNMNRDLPVHHNLFIPNISLHTNLYPQYSENVHICIVGPPDCGKADLIKTFARDDNILIPTGKPFIKVFQQGMVCFGTNLAINIWFSDDLILNAEDLRSHCESSKSVIVLIYNAAQRNSLLTVVEWINYLKRDIITDVPIILVGNNTNVESSFDSSECSGVRVQEQYELEAFYQCSTESVDDVEAVFLLAAHKAFHRKIQRTIRER